MLSRCPKTIQCHPSCGLYKDNDGNLYCKGCNKPTGEKLTSKNLQKRTKKISFGKTTKFFKTTKIQYDKIMCTQHPQATIVRGYGEYDKKLYCKTCGTFCGYL